MEASSGRQLWTELHTYAWTYPETPSAEDQRTARAWLADFARRVHEASGGGCLCHDEWTAMTRRCPIPLDSRADFYWWTVAAHDAINQRLGRPLAAPEWSSNHTLLCSN